MIRFVGGILPEFRGNKTREIKDGTKVRIAGKEGVFTLREVVDREAHGTIVWNAEINGDFSFRLTDGMEFEEVNG